MQRKPTDTEQSIPGEPRSGRRQYRLVPPAITPLRADDIAGGLIDHVRGTGRRAFRDDVAAFLDAEATATFTSFRRALAACLLELASLDDGRAVLIPAFCSPDFRKTVEGVGLDPVLYDVDDRTLALDVETVERRLDDDTLALVAVNVLGYGSPMAEIADVCETRGVRLVEALGYAIGSEYDGQRLGTFGDCAVCNFQQGKPIPVGGGMVVSQEPRLDIGDDGRPTVRPNVGTLSGYALFSRPRFYYLYDLVADVIRDYGTVDRVTTHPGSKRPAAYDPPFATISDFQGGVARRVFGRRDSHRGARARTARYYAHELGDCAGIRQIRQVDGLSNHQFVRYPLVAASVELRDAIKEALRAAGIGSTILYDYPPIDGDRFPNAARLQNGVVTLPTHPYVSRQDRQITVETVRSVTRAFASDGRDQ
jgi:perosamine synthetase